MRNLAQTWGYYGRKQNLKLIFLFSLFYSSFFFFHWSLNICQSSVLFGKKYMENAPKWNRAKNGIILGSEIINGLMFLPYQSLIRKPTRTEFFDLFIIRIFFRFNLNRRSGKGIKESSCLLAVYDQFFFFE